MSVLYSLYGSHAGLSARELEEAREKHADYYDRHSKRPKEKLKYSFEDKQQFDYVRELTAKNVW